MDKRKAVAAIVGWVAVCLLSIIMVFYAVREFIRGCFLSKKEG